MSSQRVPVPTRKDASGLQEIGGMITSRFPEAIIDVGPSTEEKGAWTMLVYLEDEDDKYEELANLVYGRLTELRYDEGVKIEMLPFDKAYVQAVRRYMKAVHDLDRVTDAQVIDVPQVERLKRVAASTRTAQESVAAAWRQARRQRKNHPPSPM